MEEKGYKVLVGNLSETDRLENAAVDRNIVTLKRSPKEEDDSYGSVVGSCEHDYIKCLRYL